jgi:hypothetical protein
MNQEPDYSFLASRAFYRVVGYDHDGSFLGYFNLESRNFAHHSYSESSDFSSALALVESLSRDGAAAFVEIRTFIAGVPAASA